MLTVTFRNIHTDDSNRGDYEWRVYVNLTEIAAGRLCGHERSAGWPALLMQLAREQATNAVVGGAAAIKA